MFTANAIKKIRLIKLIRLQLENRKFELN